MPIAVACYKWVLDEDGIRIGNDLSVDLEKAHGKISLFDRSAIEAATRLAESHAEFTPVALTYGTDDTEKSLKDALSRGLEVGYWVTSPDAAESDGRATAKALAAAIARIDDVALVFCAEGASDTYARQVGPRLGVELGWPLVTSVLSFEVDGDSVVATRKLEDTVQTVRVKCPAVICVLQEGFEPRAAGLKAIMAANKKPKEHIELADLGVDAAGLSKRVALKGFSMERKHIVIAEEDVGLAARELAGALRKEGVL